MFGPGMSRYICANMRLLRASQLPSRMMNRIPNPAQRTLPPRMLIRHQFNGPRAQTKAERLRQAYREHPILLPTGFVCVFISFLFLGYVNYVYFVQIMAYHTFPEPVAKELRKAIYYDKGYGQDPKKAFHHYKEALFVATDLGMNPYSAEFMGMRIRMAEFLEQHRQFEQAIVVLEKERDLCYEYMEKARNEKEVPQAQWDRIVGAAVRLGVKLGKLYGDEEVDNAEAAQGAFVMAVETLLKERQRREEEGVQEEFLENEEIGGSLEELGHSYLDSKQPELALPLFLQALSLSPAQSCHRAMLMNQISAALSLQIPGTAAVFIEAPKGKSAVSVPSLAEQQKQAKQWAENALALAQAVPPPNRTEECDIACAVITHNLAELASLSGDIVSAKSLFQEAKSLSIAMNFQDGVQEATAALQRLQEPAKA